MADPGFTVCDEEHWERINGRHYPATSEGEPPCAPEGDPGFSVEDLFPRLIRWLTGRVWRIWRRP